MTDLTEQEKKLLIKMQIEEESDQKSGVSYIRMMREALKEQKLRKRRELSEKILEVIF